MHIHLINFEVIGRFYFEIDRFYNDYVELNGPLTKRGFTKNPTQIDVRAYKTSEIIPP